MQPENQAVHRFTIGGSKVKGFRVLPDGTVEDFEGTLQRFYQNLNRASLAARRKYHDASITITDLTPDKKHYKVDLDKLMEIAEEIN